MADDAGRIVIQNGPGGQWESTTHYDAGGNVVEQTTAMPYGQAPQYYSSGGGISNIRPEIAQVATPEILQATGGQAIYGKTEELMKLSGQQRAYDQSVAYAEKYGTALADVNVRLANAERTELWTEKAKAYGEIEAKYGATLRESGNVQTAEDMGKVKTFYANPANYYSAAAAPTAAPKQEGGPLTQWVIGQPVVAGALKLWAPDEKKIAAGNLSFQDMRFEYHKGVARGIIYGIPESIEGIGAAVGLVAVAGGKALTYAGTGNFAPIAAAAAGGLTLAGAGIAGIGGDLMKITPSEIGTYFAKPENVVSAGETTGKIAGSLAVGYGTGKVIGWAGKEYTLLKYGAETEKAAFAVSQGGQILPALPKTSFIASHPTLIAAAGYGIAGGFEAVKVGTMKAQGATLSQYGPEVAKDIAFFGGFSMGLKSGLTEGGPIMYEKISYPKQNAPGVVKYGYVYGDAGGKTFGIAYKGSGGFGFGTPELNPLTTNLLWKTPTTAGETSVFMGSVANYALPKFAGPLTEYYGGATLIKSQKAPYPVKEIKWTNAAEGGIFNEQRGLITSNLVGKYKPERIGGWFSTTQETTGPGAITNIRPFGDVDLYYSTLSAAKTEKIVNFGVGKLQAAGENVKVYGGIETGNWQVRIAGKAGGKLWDIHSGESTAIPPYSLGETIGYGFNQQAAFKLGGQNFVSFGEQYTRKFTSVFTPVNAPEVGKYGLPMGSFMPETQRVKDIADLGTLGNIGGLRPGAEAGLKSAFPSAFEGAGKGSYMLFSKASPSSALPSIFPVPSAAPSYPHSASLSIMRPSYPSSVRSPSSVPSSPSYPSRPSFPSASPSSYSFPSSPSVPSSPSYPSYPSYPPSTSPSSPISSFSMPSDIGGFEFAAPTFLTGKRKRKYTPSVVSISLNITSPKQTQKLFTGLEIRPVIRPLRRKR